jgi:hypothetical protein
VLPVGMEVTRGDALVEMVGIKSVRMATGRQGSAAALWVDRGKISGSSRVLIKFCV